MGEFRRRRIWKYGASLLCPVVKQEEEAEACSSWLSVWVSIISAQSNQERARHLFPGRDGEFLMALHVYWHLWVGRTHSIPSRGKASMRKMNKAREDGDFPLPDLSLGARAGIGCLSKEDSHTHIRTPFKNNSEILGPRERVSGVI